MTDVMVACISAGSAIVVGVLSLLGVITTNAKSNSKIEKQLEIAQAVTDTKIEALTNEVHEHNNFARRMPVVEAQIEIINKNIEELKGYHRGK